MTHTYARVIADSYLGTRLTTLECFYPRIIHAELMTHRVFSRNAQSSRASSTKRVMEAPVFIPDPWTADRAGMSASDALTKQDEATRIWLNMYAQVRLGTEQLQALGVHKQHANRALEPWSYIKVLVTATDWDNFFDLRLAADAQPEIQVLAHAMRDAMAESRPVVRDWHTPYAGDDIPEDMRPAVSAARCARVSYGTLRNRTLDHEVEFAEGLWRNKHMSPFEHVARAAFDRHANFQGWRQLRADLELGAPLFSGANK